MLKTFRLRLERVGFNLAYSGWLTGSLSVFFFAAATNTLAGWLYLMSGILIALLMIAAIWVRRSLVGFEIERGAIAPAYVGDQVSLPLTLHNRRRDFSQPVQVIDDWPEALGELTVTSLAPISGRSSLRSVCTLTASQRGLYRWQGAALRTAAPLGLIWYRRQYPAPARLVVYPKIIPLSCCPLLDHLTSADQREQMVTLRQRQTYLDTSGTMRSLRPYRWGDPMRLIHWRSSARYGQLRTREMEDTFSQRLVTLALDQSNWRSDHFEEAVTVAASLVQYALAHQIEIRLWTTGTGVITGFTSIMEVLARVQANAEAQPVGQPSTALKRQHARIQGSYLGLTTDPSQFSRDLASGMPVGWIVWSAAAIASTALTTSILQIQPDQPLQPQLQRG
ncbi:MAG: DUF58 domain-containing protein [Elainellaceae cyanobacterium]